MGKVVAERDQTALFKIFSFGKRQKGDYYQTPCVAQAWGKVGRIKTSPGLPALPRPPRLLHHLECRRFAANSQWGGGNGREA